MTNIRSAARTGRAHLFKLLDVADGAERRDIQLAIVMLSAMPGMVSTLSRIATNKAKAPRDVARHRISQFSRAVRV